MNTVITILLTVLIFGVIVFIHEFGHFIVARLTGVTVVEFSIGMGPTLFKHQGKKTLYSFRLLPIGGFCAMLGEDAAGGGSVALSVDRSEDADASDETEHRPDPGELSAKSVPARIAISAAGACMNLLLGFAVILATLLPSKYYASTQVAVFKEEATSAETGLSVGDRILRINGTRLFSYQDITFELLRDNDGIVDMQVLRNGEKVELEDVTFTVTGEETDRNLYLDFKVLAVEPSFFGAIRQAFGETLSLARNSWVSIADLITGREMLTGQMGLQDLSGPVGVGQIVGQAAAIGWKSLFSIGAFISISIGMFNLLPFPALDGGRIVFLLIEGIFRKPINPKWEGYVNAAGLLLLFGLMILVTFKDIWNLF